MKRLWPPALLALVLIAALIRPVPDPAPVSLPPPVQTLDEAAPEGLSVTDEPQLPPESPADPEETPVRNYDWRESPSLRSLVWLAQNQNGDGSWGDGPAILGSRGIGRTGITALALLSFLGGGYSPLSKDQYDDQDLGHTVRRAMAWLFQDQQENGTFRSVHDGVLDQAIASFALNEAYGMTGSQGLREPAQKAFDALLLLQGPDGSWGDDGPSAWAMWSLRSAELNEQPFAPDAKARAAQFAAGSSESGIVDSRMKWSRKRTAEDQLHLLTLGAPQSLGFDRLHFGTAAAFRFDGPDGPVWKQWREGMLDAVLPTQDGDGTWWGGTRSQTVVRSSLALQSLQVAYTYRPGVFGGY